MTERKWAILNVEFGGRRCCIVIDGTKILKIVDSTEIEGIDASDLIAIPSLVDPHVHSRVMGQEYKEDRDTVQATAFCGGVATMFDMPNNSRPVTTIDALEEKAALFTSGQVDVRFWFGATPTNSGEFSSLVDDARVPGIKFYMGSSTGDLLVSTDAELEVGFKAATELGILVAVHAEDEKLMNSRYGRIVAQRNGQPLISDHCLIRDTEVEVSAVKRALTIQRKTGARIYFCHLSSPDAVELVKDAKDAGATVYVEVCPHHLFFDDRKLQTRGEAFFKMNPSLRSAKQVTRLRALVCRPDFVDCIGTDHAPHTTREKTTGDYDTTPSGVTGLDTLFSSMFSLVTDDLMTMDRFVSLTSGRAGEIFDLESAGKIEVGMQANLLLVNPDSLFTWNDDLVTSKCGWTPFEGMGFHANISHVVSNGQLEKVRRPYR